MLISRYCPQLKDVWSYYKNCCIYGGSPLGKNPFRTAGQHACWLRCYPYIKTMTGLLRASCSKVFPTLPCPQHVKPIETGGRRVSVSGKSLIFHQPGSGSTLFNRVGSTRLQITNSAGKILCHLRVLTVHPAMTKPACYEFSKDWPS